MGRQVAPIVPARTGRAVRTPLDDPLRLFLRGIEHALRDLHVFEWQVVLIGCSFSDLAPNFSWLSWLTTLSSRPRASSDTAKAAWCSARVACVWAESAFKRSFSSWRTVRFMH